LSWLAALLVAGGAVAFLHQSGAFNAALPRVEIPLPQVSTPDQVNSANSSMTGVDRQNLPYAVRAGSTIQDATDGHKFHLKDVAGDFQRPGNRRLKVTALTAQYHSKSRLLDLAGQVRVEEVGRFVADMEKAHVVLEQKSLTSDGPVTVIFADGSISANGLAVTNDGNNILFTRGVKAHFGGVSLRGDGAP
jgi:LPS export ABC transporter protein LptC